MKEKKLSKSEKVIPDLKSIEQQIVEKRKQLEEIHVSLATWLLGEMTYAQRAKVKELEDRLFFRTQQAENALLDDKIDLYSQALNILKR